MKDKKIKKSDKSAGWKEKADEYLNGWKRAKADFINYKNRQDEVMADFRKYAKEGFVMEILPVLDSLNEALKHVPEDQEESEWVMGIKNIKNQFNNLLKAQGLEEIKTVGEKFNPEFHEAVELIESDEESGTIINELQAGYTLNGKVIRAAKVKVAK